MFDLLRKLDDAVFSPPHRFEDVLLWVAATLGVDLSGDSTTAQSNAQLDAVAEGRREKRLGKP